MKKKYYTRNQKIWVEKNNIVIGSKVKVCFISPSFYDGWDNSLEPQMNLYVGDFKFDELNFKNV